MKARARAGVRLRHVVAGDEAALREIRLASLRSDPEAFGSTYERDACRPDDFWVSWAARSEAGEAERTFVLTDETWLGLVLVRLESATRAELLAMWIAPEERGRGGAQILCEACAEWARERGCEELTLSVEVDNERARRAYMNAGFVPCGRTKSAHGKRILDVHLMSRPL